MNTPTQRNDDPAESVVAAEEHLGDVLGDAGAENLPAVVDPPTVDDTTPQSLALADLQTRALNMPVEQMKLGLAEYENRRYEFRAWLLSQLKEGLHYGYPPGCAPRNNGPTKEQWTNKKSLYKAGADFVVDLMGILPVYSNDMDTWKQCGEKPLLICYVCILKDKTGEPVGEGRGTFQAKNADDSNKAAKMAKKRAKVDAVLDAYGLSDLFTQDIEDGLGAPPPAHPNPKPRKNAPKAPTRGERTGEVYDVAKQELIGLHNMWKERHVNGNDSKAFRPWISEVIGRNFDYGDQSLWARGEFIRCCDAVEAL
jgi:hypothetical protein